MIVSDLSPTALRARLGGNGLELRTASFVSRIQSRIERLAAALELMYADFPVADPGTFADFQVRVAPPAGPRRWLRAQAYFYVDGFPAFKPLPYAQAFPMLEWGLNWCISNLCHDHLILHAAVVAKNGAAALLPAPPGSGKSTLCAILIQHGWRLLSDELALIRLSDGTVTPLPRPVSLKNRSIEVVRRNLPDVVLSPAVRDTIKGTVAHMKPPADSVHRAREQAFPRWIIFPTYADGADARLTLLTKPATLMRVADNAFNYSLLGAQAFRTLCDVVGKSQCYEFTYSRLDDAVATFAAL